MVRKKSISNYLKMALTGILRALIGIKYLWLWVFFQSVIEHTHHLWMAKAEPQIIVALSASGEAQNAREFI
jgi:hypothetical protein